MKNYDFFYILHKENTTKFYQPVQKILEGNFFQPTATINTYLMCVANALRESYQGTDQVFFVHWQHTYL